LSSPAPEVPPPLLIPVGVLGPDSPHDARLIDLAAVVAGQRDGSDPTSTWRMSVWRGHQAGYGDAPVSVAVTFVAQWVLQALACAVVASDRSGSHLASALSVQIAPDATAFYPTAVLIERTALLPGRSGDPHSAYRRAALAFIDTYRPGLPMSSRQRHGLVHDVWQAATVSTPARRRSCCFLYALPGMRVCAGCPRITAPAVANLAPRANRGT